MQLLPRMPPGPFPKEDCFPIICEDEQVAFPNFFDRQVFQAAVDQDFADPFSARPRRDGQVMDIPPPAVVAA